MSVIGPAFGADAQRVMNEVEGKTRSELAGGVEVDGEPYDLTDEMVSYEAEPPEDVSAAAFEGGTVYVDTELTDDIEAEGYAREIIRRVQEARKDLDLDIDAEIHLDIAVADDRIADLVVEYHDLVAEETRATLADVDEGFHEAYDIEGVEVTLGVTRAN